MRRGLAAIGVTLGLLAGSVTTANSAAADSGCPSTSAPPQSGSVYQVSTPGHLQWIKDANVSGSNAQWDYDYVQTADIDMTGCTWNSTIGTFSTALTGSYDGGGFAISNLTLAESTSSDVVIGMFGYVGVTGVVRNTHLRNVTLTTTDSNLGLLIGVLFGTLQRSSATGSVTGVGNVGGLVGAAGGTSTIGLVEDSWADVAVQATSVGGGAGGLVGLMSENSEVRRSYSSGSVAAALGLGGLVGFMNAGTVTDSYARASVSIGATNGVSGGGLVGVVTSGAITNSYATGAVSGTNILGYGFIGVGSPTTSANFWDAETSGQSSPGPGGSEATGKTTAQMTTVSTFSDANWSIANGYSTSATWGICPGANDGYPFLVATQSSNPCTADPQAAAAEFTYLLPDGRECTSISPERVIIGTVHQLPGREALCQTSDGSLVAGWVIPVPEGFTGAGSSANPFNPGHQVFVSDSQQFTLVPYEQVLTITYDANVAIGHDCKPNDVTHASANGHHQSIWVPRTDFAMARTPSIAPCTPMGHMLTGWNTAGDGSGDALSLGAELPESWATGNSNAHTLYAVWEASPAAD